MCLSSVWSETESWDSSHDLNWDRSGVRSGVILWHSLPISDNRSVEPSSVSTKVSPGYEMIDEAPGTALAHSDSHAAWRRFPEKRK